MQEKIKKYAQNFAHIKKKRILVLFLAEEEADDDEEHANPFAEG